MRALLFVGLVCSFSLSACGDGGSANDAGPIRPIDTNVSTMDTGGGSLDDAGGGTTDDAGGGTTDDAGGGTTDDAGGGTTEDAGGMASDGGPDAPRVSMPCTAAGACDPFDSAACGAGMACRAGAMGGPTSCAPTSATVVALGATCTAGSQCPGGSSCLDFGDGLKCHQLCPMGSLGACPGGVCTGTITGGDPCIQVCRPLPERCNIYVQDCVDPLDTCTLASNPETDERYTGCRPAGTRTDGQPCGGGAGTCGHGLICINNGDGTSSCHFACDGAVAPTTCPAGQACTGTARSWGVGYCRG